MIFHFGYLGKIVDEKTAHLYGNLEEKNFMEGPQVMSNVKTDDCITLNNCIYGRVQAVRQ